MSDIFQLNIRISKRSKNEKKKETDRTKLSLEGEMHVDHGRLYVLSRL